MNFTFPCLYRSRQSTLSDGRGAPTGSSGGDQRGRAGKHRALRGLSHWKLPNRSRLVRSGSNLLWMWIEDKNHFFFCGCDLKKLSAGEMGCQFLNSCLKISAMNTHNCANLIYVVNSIHVNVLWTLSPRSLEWYYNIQLKDSGLLIIRTKLKCMTPNLLLVHVCMYSVHLCLDMFSFEFSFNCVENNCNVQVSLVCLVEMQNSTSYFMYHILIISYETIIWCSQFFTKLTV